MSPPDESPDSAPPASEISPELRVAALRQVNRKRSPLAFFWEWTKIFPEPRLCKAVVDGLHRLRRPSDVAAMRGRSVQELFGITGGPEHA